MSEVVAAIGNVILQWRPLEATGAVCLSWSDSVVYVLSPMYGTSKAFLWWDVWDLLVVFLWAWRCLGDRRREGSSVARHDSPD